MEKENEAIQKQLDCLKQAMDEEDEEVKFMFSKKVTKIDEFFTMDLTLM